MKKLFSLALLAALALGACKKDAPEPAPAPASTVTPPPSFNGGNLLGWWDAYVIEEFNYQNGTLVSQASTPIPAGEEMVRFHADSTYMLWHEALPDDSGAFHVYGNLLDVPDAAFQCRYGVTGNVMSWLTVADTTVNGTNTEIFHEVLRFHPH